MRGAAPKATEPRSPRVGRALPMLCALLVGVSAAWGLWPLGPTTVAVPEITANVTPTETAALATLDLQAFRAPLWVAPPAPPAPPVAAATPPPPPPPLKLQLIAIVREAGQGAGESIYKAALYDPDADTLTVVGPGDTIAGRTIERVTASDVSLIDNGRSRTLSLRTEGGTP